MLYEHLSDLMRLFIKFRKGKQAVVSARMLRRTREDAYSCPPVPRRRASSRAYGGMVTLRGGRQ